VAASPFLHKASPHPRIRGVYREIAFSVDSRGQETAIRIAFGSPRSTIVRRVLQLGIKLAVNRCALGSH
jgi:hypothetical protein